jgi:ABC transporter substrate binding protein
VSTRREFISLLGGAAAAWPLAARAQQSSIPVVGFLSTAPPRLYEHRLRPFREGLKEAGYVEGRNVEIDYRWAEAQNNRLSALAAELVQRQVAVIVAAGGTPSAVAAKAATKTIPIVFGVAVDPVEVGLVASLNRPGGNVTGVTNLNVEVGPKRLELLHELLPSVTVIAVLVNPASPAIVELFMRGMQADPNCASPSRNAATSPRASGSFSERFMSTPMRRFRSICCGRAASGQTATAPPSSVMNSRRFIRSARRHARAIRAAG